MYSNNNINITTKLIKDALWVIAGIAWAIIFPIVNLFLRFCLTYSPISKHPFEKYIFVISSLLVVIAWSILCVWAAYALISEFPLWADFLVVLVGSAIYICYIIIWKMSFNESIAAFGIKQ